MSEEKRAPLTRQYAEEMAGGSGVPPGGLPHPQALPHPTEGMAPIPRDLPPPPPAHLNIHPHHMMHGKIFASHNLSVQSPQCVFYSFDFLIECGQCTKDLSQRLRVHTVNVGCHDPLLDSTW